MHAWEGAFTLELNAKLFWERRSNQSIVPPQPTDRRHSPLGVTTVTWLGTHFLHRVPGELFSEVRGLVRDEACFLYEALGAVAAGVGLLPGVDSQVDHEAGSLPVAFLTVLAGERPLLGVSPLVQSKSCPPVEALPTAVALVTFLLRVSFQVSHQVGPAGKPFAALVALGGVFATVPPLVHGEVRALSEALVAQGALVGPLPGVDAHVPVQV